MVSMRSMIAIFMRDPYRIYYFFICCVATFILIWKKKIPAASVLAKTLVLPSLFLIVGFINPISTHFLVNNSEETRVARFFWIVPVPVILGAATVLILARLKPQWLERAVALAVIPVILLFANNFRTLKSRWNGWAQNAYKIPSVVIDLCDYIKNDDSCSEKAAVFPLPLNIWVHQYCADIDMPFARVSGDWEEEGTVWRDLYDEMRPIGATNDGNPNTRVRKVNLDRVSYLCKVGGYHYIVLPREGDYRGSLEDHGFKEVYSVAENSLDGTTVYDQEYVLYLRTEENE